MKQKDIQDAYNRANKLLQTANYGLAPAIAQDVKNLVDYIAILQEERKDETSQEHQAIGPATLVSNIDNEED